MVEVVDGIFDCIWVGNGVEVEGESKGVIFHFVIQGSVYSCLVIFMSFVEGFFGLSLINLKRKRTLNLKD
jgi:hypothetical protein